jgi:hypothetical protein
LSEAPSFIRTPKAPCRLNITFFSNLVGVGVGISSGPSDRDPLDQHRSESFYLTVEDAIADLPRLVDSYLIGAIDLGRSRL